MNCTLKTNTKLLFRKNNRKYPYLSCLKMSNVAFVQNGLTDAILCIRRKNAIARHCIMIENMQHSQKRFLRVGHSRKIGVQFHKALFLISTHLFTNYNLYLFGFNAGVHLLLFKYSSFSYLHLTLVQFPFVSPLSSMHAIITAISMSPVSHLTTATLSSRLLIGFCVDDLEVVNPTTWN